MTVYNTPPAMIFLLGIIVTPVGILREGGIYRTPVDGVRGRLGFQIVHHPRVVYRKGVIARGGDSSGYKRHETSNDNVLQ